MAKKNELSFTDKGNIIRGAVQQEALNLPYDRQSQATKDWYARMLKMGKK